MLKSKKGQSTLEYIILVAGGIVVIIAFVAGSDSPFGQAFNRALNTATDGMESMADALRNSRVDANGIPI